MGSRRMTLALLLSAAVAGPAVGGPPAGRDPMETLPDRIELHRIALPDSARAAAILAEQQKLIEQGQAAAEGAAEGRTAAARLAWDTVTSCYGSAGAPVNALNLLYETKLASNLGTAMGDAGLVLALAQYNIDAHDPTSGTANLAGGKSVALWAAGRFGWRALRVSMGAVGLVDYMLDQLGRSSIRSRRLVLDSAFFNYHHPGVGEGWLTEKQWAQRLWQADVRSKEDAYRHIRAYFELFWKKGPEAIQRYYIPEQVNFKANPLDKTLIALSGGAGRMSYTKDDCRAVEDSFLRTYLAPMLETYFTRTLPGRIRDQARAQAAERMKQVVTALNTPSVIRVRVEAPAPSGGSRRVQLGPWRQPVPPSGEVTFRFTKYAFLKNQVAQKVRLYVQAPGAPPASVDLPIRHPVDVAEQEVVFRGGEAVRPDDAALPGAGRGDRARLSEALCLTLPKDLPDGWRLLENTRDAKYQAEHGKPQWQGSEKLRWLKQYFGILRGPYTDYHDSKLTDTRTGQRVNAYDRYAAVQLKLLPDAGEYNRHRRYVVELAGRPGAKWLDRDKTIVLLGLEGSWELQFVRRDLWCTIKIMGPGSPTNPAHVDEAFVRDLAAKVLRKIDAAPAQ